MGRLGLLIACCTLLAGNSISQQRELDSLMGLLKKYSKEDTVRLQLLNDIAYEYSRIDPARGLQTADQAIRLAQKLRSIKKLASAYNYKAMNYGGLGEDSLALQFYEKALGIHQQVNDRLRMAACYNNIAIALVNLSDYTKALGYHEKAFGIFQQLNDSIRMGNSLNNRGVIYLHLADYDQALKYHLQALQIFEHQQNQHITANTLINVGLVYDHLSNFEKAREFQQRALHLYEKSGNKQGMINALGNLGNIYHNMGEDEQALKYYQRALDSSLAIGDKRGIASNYSNMGIVYNGLSNFPKALEYLHQSLELNQQSGDRKRIAGDLNEIGKVYLHAPDALLLKNGVPPAQRLKKVIEYESRGLDLAKQIGSLDMQREALYVLSRAYEMKKEFNKSLDAYKQYVVMRDSIINTEMKNDVTRREMQFEYGKKELLLKAEQEKRQAASLAALNRQRLVNNTIAGMAGVLLVAGVLSFVFYKRKRDAEEKGKEAEFKLRSAETEMHVLRLQMNPHFIFNSLNSINNCLDKHDTGKAALYTTKFAKLMRMTLESSRHEEVTLLDDLHALELYMQLESLRLQGSFSYEIKIDEGIDAATTLVPPMMLQPFVENSIWHGLSKKTGQGKINIHIRKEDGMINCTVEDNGIGRKQAEAGSVDVFPLKKSLGIKITNDRIDLINRVKRTAAGVRLSDLDEGFRAEIVLPYETWS